MLQVTDAAEINQTRENNHGGGLPFKYNDIISINMTEPRVSYFSVLLLILVLSFYLP